jgi:predicted alpha/beta-hydrolase family hydrolase
MRVSAPVIGSDLPIILLSHGHGSSNHLSSLNGYAPLANFWAAHGFVVIQPTHLSSKTLHGIVDPNGPEGPLFWRSRAEDMHRILDHLDAVEDAVPELRGRLDRGRIAVAGHSLGGLTASMLLGAQVLDEGGSLVDLSDARIKAGVVMAAPGEGALLNGPAGERFPFLKHLDFAGMTTSALVVVGDRDVNPAFSDRVEYRAGAYTLSPSPKSLLTLFGAEHILGGISGYDAAETTDESPERVEVVGRLTWAYLRTALYPEDLAWSTACAALVESSNPLGRIESK